MKNRAIKIFVFFLFLVFFDRSISFLISRYNHIFFSNNALKKPLSEFLNGRDYNTLILGTSRTYQGIHPELIKSAKLKPFKWSHAGNGPKYNYYFYKLYKQIKGTPEIVIFGMDYFIYSITTSMLSLSEVKEYTSTDIMKDLFSPTLLLLKNKSDTDILLNDILNSFKVSELSLFNRIKDTQAYTGVEKDTLPNFKVITKKKFPFIRRPFFKLPGKEGKYFLMMLDEIRRDNSMIILVVIPDYIGTLKTNLSQGRFKRHLRRLGRKYKNLKILNYTVNKKFNLKDESLFIDGGYGIGNSHMSKKGAVIFNRMLKRDLEKITP